MSEAIQSKEQFSPPTPESEYRRWMLELEAARENQADFWKQGDRAIDEFLGIKANGQGARLNLWHSDVKTKEAVLSGTPRVRSRRRYADANDDVARVSAECLDRLLNADTEKDSDGLRKVLQKAKADWLKAGMGLVRFRYTFDTEAIPAVPAQKREEPCDCVEMGGAADPECAECEGAGVDEVEIAPEVPEREEKRDEQVDCVYVYWRDVLWSPCRDWSELRWIDFPSEVTKDEAAKLFGEDVADALPMKKRVKEDDSDEEKKAKDAWQRIQLHEVWCKEDRKLYFLVEGYPQILKTVEDPLQLPGFFPCPEPLSTNVAPGKWLPRSNFFLSEDQYAEVHALTARINLLVKALKVVGVYDKASDGIQRMLDEGAENELIPVDNWAAFAEKGGIAGSVAFMPIKDVVDVVDRLVMQRNIVRQTISEVQGISDIMRGQSAERVTATTDRIKARFGSSRIQYDQEHFAEFASAAQRIRAQIISRWFSPETIAERSNMGQTEDAQLLPQAIDLLKSDIAGYRIEVDADQLAMTDYDSLSQERTQGAQTLGGIWQASVPFLQIIAQAGPEAAAAAVGLVSATTRWVVAGMRGSAALEAECDKFDNTLKKVAADAQQQAQMAAMQPPPPDPKVEAEKVKAQGVMVKAQADQQKAQMGMAVTAQKAQVQMASTQMDAAQKRAEFGMRMAELAAKKAEERDTAPFSVEDE